MQNQHIFKNTAFLRLLIGSTASGFSTWGLVFLLGLMVANDEMQATQLGFVLGIRTVGFLLGVLFGGIWADGISPRKVILGSSLISMFAIGLIMIGLTSHASVLYLGATLAGLGQGGCRPAYQAMVVQVVNKAQLQPANAWMGLSIRLVNLIGPAVTSAIVLVSGSIAAFALLLLMWGVSAFLPPWVREAQKARVTNTPLGTMIGDVVADLLDGVREARRHPWFIWSLLALTLVIATGYSATNVILPLISEANGGLTLMTQCITAYTLGGAIGAVVLSKFQPKQFGWYALVGMASYGLAPISLLFADTFIVALVGYCIAGFGIEMFNVLWFTSIQREVPETHLARISSLDFLCSYGLAPLGLGVIAPIAGSIGHTNTLLICGLICLIAPLLVMLSRSSKHYSNKT